MKIEISAYEAEVLIGVLTGAEGAFAVTSPGLSEALKSLRPWRSTLVQGYLRERIEAMALVAAVDPQVGDSSK